MTKSRPRSSQRRPDKSRSRRAMRSGGKVGRKPLTRQAVIKAARELLAAEGLESLSLRGVAARMGVTAPALYAHVDDKLDLMRKLGEDGFERLIRKFAPIDTTRPMEQIRQIATAYLAFARANPEQFRVMFLFPTPIVGPPKPDSLLNSGRAYGIASAAVERAIEAGDLAPEDPALATLTIWSSVHGVTMAIIAGGDFGRGFDHRLMMSVVDTLLEGFAAP